MNPFDRDAFNAWLEQEIKKLRELLDPTTPLAYPKIIVPPQKFTTQVSLYVPPPPKPDTWFAVNAFGPIIQNWQAYYINNIVHGPIEPSIPDTASPLWNNPETVTEEITAYRAWEYNFRVGKDGVEILLESLHFPVLWEGPVMTASEVPTSDNRRGLYAIAPRPHHRTNYASYLAGKPVWGRVALSGVVVEGDRGYRAERMTVQEIWLNPERFVPDNGDAHDGYRRDDSETVMRLLADRYQCDCTMLAPDWEKLCAV